MDFRTVPIDELTRDGDFHQLRQSWRRGGESQWRLVKQRRYIETLGEAFWNLNGSIGCGRVRRRGYKESAHCRSRVMLRGGDRFMSAAFG